MIRAQVAIKRPFVAVAVLGVLLGVTACGPIQISKPDPLKFGSAWHFLRTDRLKMSRDLERERRDAQAGQSGTKGLSSCYNLKQNVDVEVSAMDSFAAGTVTANVAAMQNDVTTMRRERANFERDVNDFVNDGVARPKGEQGTVEAITGKIRRAVHKADAMIRAIRRQLHEAHISADLLATGTCANVAPAGAPAIPRVH